MALLHLQCIREEREKAATKFKEQYHPEKTVVVDYPLPFSVRGMTVEFHFPVAWLIMQWFPCCLLKLLSPLIGSWPPKYIDLSSFNHSMQNVTFYDARKQSPGTFNETGFALIQLDKEAETTDWRTSYLQQADADVTKFHKQMEPEIRRLYPGVKRVRWLNNIIRGGSMIGDQPAAVDGPHLDYHQNKTARIEFHKEFPIKEINGFKLNTEAFTLLEESNSEEKLGVMLGIWKPIRPGKLVCDHPLAIMDARTFTQDHDNPYRLQISLPIIGMFGYDVYNLNGAISYDPAQRWYYWPFQRTNEVLVFHQYSEGQFWANPHTSFTNRNCPPDTETRVSAELRVVLYF